MPHRDCTGDIEVSAAVRDAAVAALRDLDLSTINPLDALAVRSWLDDPNQIWCKACVRAIERLTGRLFLTE